MRIAIIASMLVWLTAPAAWPRDFQDFLQAGRDYYNHGKHDEAIKELQEAVRLQPNSSEAHLWLGRALGRKAEKSSRFRAAFIVGDVRRAFERAVQLDPSNVEARSDLLDFYLEAPGMFGGGVDKAKAQAEAIAQLNRAEGHSARARIAAKEKRYQDAEREYRLAAEANPQHAGYRRDLTEFRNKQMKESGVRSKPE